jgi:hypothetical protein
MRDDKEWNASVIRGWSMSKLKNRLLEIQAGVFDSQAETRSNSESGTEWARVHEEWEAMWESIIRAEIERRRMAGGKV